MVHNMARPTWDSTTCGHCQILESEAKKAQRSHTCDIIKGHWKSKRFSNILSYWDIDNDFFNKPHTFSISCSISCSISWIWRMMCFVTPLEMLQPARPLRQKFREPLHPDGWFLMGPWGPKKQWFNFHTTADDLHPRPISQKNKTCEVLTFTKFKTVAGESRLEFQDLQGFFVTASSLPSRL